MENIVKIGNLCACMGPRFGQPFCPCEMQRKGLSDGKEYAWTAEDKERLRKALEKFVESEKGDTIMPSIDEPISINNI